MSKPFEGVFGSTSELKILEFLLPLENFEFNVSQLAKEVKISRKTIIRVVSKLIEFGILREGKKNGNEKIVSLNEKSPYVAILHTLNNTVIEHILN